MSVAAQLYKVAKQLKTLGPETVGSQLKGNLVTASAPPSVNVPRARVKRPPSAPELRIASAVPRDRTGGISTVLPRSYSPTSVPSFPISPQFGTLGENISAKYDLKEKYEKLKKDFFSGFA